MPRLLFAKEGNAVWISHLDLMRLFQRAFKRAGLPLKHTQGFNPRPSVSIALPMSVGIESRCEILDFDLEGEKISNDQIREQLNRALVEGVTVLDVYDPINKLNQISLMDCTIWMKYDQGVPDNAAEVISDLFQKNEILVEKKNKNGVSVQNIAEMIKYLKLIPEDEHTILIRTRVCCQNPTLNPMQIYAAMVKYTPGAAPDFVKYRRDEIYTGSEEIFR